MKKYSEKKSEVKGKLVINTSFNYIPGGGRAALLQIGACLR